MKNFVILSLIAGFVVGLEALFGTQALIPVSSAFALIAVGVGSWLALEQYALKLNSQKVETDIQLMTLFTKIMKTAHARETYSMSEKTIEKLFDNRLLPTSVLENSQQLSAYLEQAAILTTPVGAAEQEAAIVAIWTLAKRHSALKEVARQSLISLKTMKPELAKEGLAALGEK